MKKLFFAMLMVGVFVLSIPIGAEAITYAKGIYLDGQLIKTEVAPVIENGRTLVPVRGVLEAMGATVTWDNKTRTASAYLGENSTSVTIDSYTAYVNGYSFTLEVPPKIINGRTMVPLRFMAEAIGYDVSFKDGYVYINYPGEGDSADFYTRMNEFDKNVVQPEFQVDGGQVFTTYNEEENAVVISLKGKGMTDEIMQMTSSPGFETEWGEFVDYMGTVSLGIVEYFSSYGYDVNGVVEIINDQNSEYVLLQVQNGVVIYDETALYE